MTSASKEQLGEIIREAQPDEYKEETAETESKPESDAGRDLDSNNSEQVSETGKQSGEQDDIHRPDDSRADTEEADATQDLDAESQHGEEEEAAVTLDEIAERLEVDAADLYDIELTLPGDGEKITLGELKDQHHQLMQKKDRLDNLEREEVNLRAAATKAQNDLANLVGYLPKESLTPEFLSAVKEQVNMKAQMETKALLELRPTWSDPTVYAAAEATMEQCCKDYGLQKADMDNIQDHRFISMLHDLAELRQAKSTAEKTVKKIPLAASRKTKGKDAKAKSKLAEKLRAKAKAGDKQAQKVLVGDLISGTMGNVDTGGARYSRNR